MEHPGLRARRDCAIDLKKKRVTSKIQKKPKGRPVGILTPLQVKQRAENRTRIIEAAKIVFASKSYIQTSIEDISAACGISRVTIYKHFKTKLDIAIGILENYAIVMIDIYGNMGECAAPDRTDIIQWIRKIMTLWREQSSNMAMLASLLRQDPALIRRRETTYHKLIERLGERIPAFAKAASGDDAARIRAHLLLVELEDLCYELVISGWQVDENLAIGIVADHFHEFIQKTA